MSALIECLRGHGERVAVLTDTEQLTYDELADRVADAAHTFGGARRLVLLETRNDISTLVHYLGALAAGTWCCRSRPAAITAAWSRPTNPTS